jgi:YceI-like domain
MTSSRRLLPALGTVLLCVAAAAAAAADVVPAGQYRLEPSHASLLFKVDHLGFSNYTARFRRFDATLQFDPARLAASQVRVTVDATSIETDFPDPAKLDFNKELQGAGCAASPGHWSSRRATTAATPGIRWTRTRASASRRREL